MSKSNQTKRKRTIDDYQFIGDPTKSPGVLGQGAYGSVKKVIDKHDNKMYAIKIVNQLAWVQHNI